VTATPSEPLLRVRGLTAGFPTLRGLALAARSVDFDVAAGSSLGLIGESGCGKSVTLRSLIGLVAAPGEVLDGEVRFDGRDLRALTPAQLRHVRGNEISMVFQDPTASLNPVYSIGHQLAEVLRVKRGMRRRAANEESVSLLARVGIPSPRARMRAYPDQLSGGMRQRVMIAIAIACGPRLLLADEPTTSLDVTIQDQILRLLRALREEHGMALIISSHDFGIVAENCDRVAVMYAGSIVESGSARDVLDHPRHPYTRALLAAVPSIDPEEVRGALPAIGGQPPDLAALPPGCPFAARCEHAHQGCRSIPMRLDRSPQGHRSACPFVGQQVEAA
jgi:oligopeptide/dipeptide ABC transporter ATP-binding protein